MAKNFTPYLNLLMRGIGMVDERMSSNKTDEIANNLMTRRLQESGDLPIPRATAVDPSIEAEMRSMYPDRATKPVLFRGGVDGAADVIRLQDAVDQGKRRGIEDSLRDQANTRAWNADARAATGEARAQSAQDWQKQKFEEQQKAREKQAADAARAATDDDYQKNITRANSFTTDITNITKSLANARTKEEYEAGQRNLSTAILGARSSGMKFDDPSIPPFRGDVITGARTRYMAVKDNPEMVGLLRQKLIGLGYDPAEAGIPPEKHDNAITAPSSSQQDWQKPTYPVN